MIDQGFGGGYKEVSFSFSGMKWAKVGIVLDRFFFRNESSVDIPTDEIGYKLVNSSHHWWEWNL